MLFRSLLLSKGICLEAPTLKTDHLVFIGNYNEQKLMVRCLPNRTGARVTAREVAEFVGILASHGYDRGLMVAAGEFAPEVGDIKSKITNSFRLEYIDITALAELARRAKHPIFPEPGASESLLREEGISRYFSMGRIKPMLFGSRAKVKRYIFAAGTLMTFYLLQPDLIFAPLYLMLALLNFLLAAACLRFAPARVKGGIDESPEPELAR